MKRRIFTFTSVRERRVEAGGERVRERVGFPQHFFSLYECSLNLVGGGAQSLSLSVCHGVTVETLQPTSLGLLL